MTQLGTKLRNVDHREGYPAGGIGHWCPGCGVMHVFAVAEWDGRTKAPSFSCQREFAARGFTTIAPATRCLYALHKGVIEYDAACTHRFAGRTVALPDLPGHLLD